MPHPPFCADAAAVKLNYMLIRLWHFSDLKSAARVTGRLAAGLAAIVVIAAEESAVAAAEYKNNDYKYPYPLISAVTASSE